MRPHNFDKLIENRRRPSIFAGAGLSWGVVPGPTQLLEEYKWDAEGSLGVAADVDPGSEGSLYEWADQILAQLSDGDGPPKLRLAQSLGILDEPVWAARVSYPASGLSARHRVLARFARENLWQGIWTWNWDCLLESALEAIGLERGDAKRDQPWLTRFNSVVVREDFARLGDRDLLCVLKPHGCAAALVAANDCWNAGNQNLAAEIAARFMIGRKELTERRDNPTDKLFFTRMQADLQSYPSVVVGWSVSEPYLQAVVNEALGLVLPKGRLEELSIVDVDFNEKGHRIVAQCYGLAADDVFFKLDPVAPGFTTDSFFLWLQARLAVARVADASLDEGARAAIIETAAAEQENRLNNWADTFLPTWTRLCWRAKVVSCAGFQAHQLAIDRAEEHIPLTLPGVDRPDLAAAGRLFRGLSGSPTLDYSSFPGGVWDQESLRLVLPLPYWGEVDELDALKPLLATHKLSYVQALDILPVHFDPAAPAASDELIRQLKYKLARSLSHPMFSNPAAIGIADDLLGRLP